jgi:S-adenosylmethionine hydrolase
LHIDGFGNIVTNIQQKELGNPKKIKVKMSNFLLNLPLARNYAQVKPNEPTALIGSQGFLEVALNQGSAAAKFGIHAGDAVEVAPA